MTQVHAGELRDAATWLARWAASKPQNPIQGGVRLTCHQTGLLLEVHGDIAAATVELAAENPQQGRAVVSARLLDAIGKTLGKQDVTIGFEDRRVTLTQGRFVSALPTLAEPDTFPALHHVDTSIGLIRGGALAEAAKRAIRAADRQPAMPMLACMCLDFGPETIRMIGASSTQSAVIELPWALNEDLLGPAGNQVAEQALPHAFQFAEAAAGFSETDVVTIGASGGLLTLSGAGRAVTMGSISPDKPWPVELVLRHVNFRHTATVEVPVADTITALRRAAVVANRERQPEAVVTFAPGEVRISARQGDAEGEAGDVVEDIDYDGPEVRVLLNPEYLGDALSGAPADRIRISFTPDGPAILLACGNWHHIVMCIKDRRERTTR